MFVFTFGMFVELVPLGGAMTCPVGGEGMVTDAVAAGVVGLLVTA